MKNIVKPKRRCYRCRSILKPVYGLQRTFTKPRGGETYVLEIPLPGVKPEEIVIEADSYSLDTRAFVRPVSSPLSEAVPLNS